MHVLLFSDDLFFASQLQAVARDQGLGFQQLTHAAQIDEGLEKCAHAVVLLDLNNPALRSDLALVARLKAARTPPQSIVAFGQHVHEARLQQARAAGCDHVFSRGQLSRQAASLLRILGN